MIVDIDNNKFTVFLPKDVAYFKVKGQHNEEDAEFFDHIVDDIINDYPHFQFASLCDFKDLILSDPRTALKINTTIKKIPLKIDYRCNAIIIRRRFFEIISAFIYSFYLKNIRIKTRIFYEYDDAVRWIESFGFELSEVKEFIRSKK